MAQAHVLGLSDMTPTNQMNVKKSYEYLELQIDQLIDEVYYFIGKNNGKLNVVDVCNYFDDVSIDIPCLAVGRIVKQGKVTTQGDQDCLYVSEKCDQ